MSHFLQLKLERLGGSLGARLHRPVNKRPSPERLQWALERLRLRVDGLTLMRRMDSFDTWNDEAEMAPTRAGDLRAIEVVLAEIDALREP